MPDIKKISRRWRKKNLVTILSFVLTGIICGLSIGIFKKLIFILSQNMKHFIVKSSFSLGSSLLVIGIFFLLASFIYLLSKSDKNIAGSGIPVIYAMLANKIDLDSKKTLVKKFIACILTIGSGLTLGREGPSVQIGGLIGDIVHKKINAKDSKIYFIGASAGAGIAVAFNAPMAGLLFTVEEIFKKTDRKVFLSSAITIFSAIITADLIFGNTPALKHIPEFDPLDLSMMGYLIILGLISGISGVFFNKVIINSKTRIEKINIHPFIKYVIPFIITAIVLLIDIRLFASGESFIFYPLYGNEDLANLIFLYFAKIILLSLTFGAGIPGGSLVPLLALGSLVGNIVALVFVNLGILDPEFIFVFSMLGMCAHFSAIVRTPITAIILILEMTGGAFSYLLGLALVALIAYSVAELCNSEPFYDHLYDLLIKKKFRELNV